MSDEAALFAAILAQPDEDTPRLAYADWLDEYGDAAQRARAEFIRLQIEESQGVPSARRKDIGDRCKALQKKHGKVWLAPFAEAIGDEKVTHVYRRGFVAEVSGLQKFPGLFPAIAAVCPVQRVDIDFEWNMKESPAWGKMGKCPGLESLRWMECRRFGESFAKKVLASPHLTGLRTLYLQWGWLEQGVELVNRSAAGKNLRHLWIWGAQAGQDIPGLSVKKLVEMKWPALTQLRLDNLAPGEDGMLEAVRGAVKQKWQAVYVHDPKVGRDGVTLALEIALAGNLPSCSLARDCDLNEPPQPVPDGVKLLALRSYSADGDALVRWIVKNVPPGRFNRLSVRHCRVSAKGAEQLAGWPGLAQLEELDLRWNDIGDRGAEVLAESDHLENIRLIQLAGNVFTEQGKAALKKEFARRVRIAE